MPIKRYAARRTRTFRKAYGRTFAAFFFLFDHRLCSGCTSSAPSMTQMSYEKRTPNPRHQYHNDFARKHSSAKAKPSQKAKTPDRPRLKESRLKRAILKNLTKGKPDVACWPRFFTAILVG